MNSKKILKLSQMFYRSALENKTAAGFMGSGLPQPTEPKAAPQFPFSQVVKDIQERLNANTQYSGLQELNEDGKYGPNTARVLTLFINKVLGVNGPSVAPDVAKFNQQDPAAVAQMKSILQSIKQWEATALPDESEEAKTLKTHSLRPL